MKTALQYVLVVLISAAIIGFFVAMTILFGGME